MNSGLLVPLITSWARMQVHSITSFIIRAGKGDKDQVAVLPDMLKLELQQHLKRVRLLWESDVRDGFGKVYLPEGLARKYPNAASRDPRSRGLGSTESRPTLRRHHVQETGLQRAVKAGLRLSGITKAALSYVAAFVRDAFAGGRDGHPHVAGVVGA